MKNLKNLKLLRLQQLNSIFMRNQIIVGYVENLFLLRKELLGKNGKFRIMIILQENLEGST